MKSAQDVAKKFAERAAAASGDYVTGAESTTKDQASAAIASAEVHKAATIASLNRGDYAKGLQRSGKDGWLKGVKSKGATRFAEGASQAQGKYAERSAPYDAARNSASSMPRGLKGSATNMARVTKVVSELRTKKVGAGA